MADRSVFEDVADALRGMVPSDLGEFRCRHHRYGIKVWFGTTPAREHYEAQVIGPQHAPEAATLALEIGFHSEHPTEADNQAVIDRLLRSEEAWRPDLGTEPVAAGFLGSADRWRRVSEIWADPDLSDPELVFEVADRLNHYLTILEPYRLAGP